ncbi:MAG: DUF2878 domain-containing protein [Arenimonas sp.]
MKFSWPNIANALGYQVVWLVTLFSASKGFFWFGFFTSLAFSALMLGFGGKAKQDRRIVLIGLILGVASDTLFAASGWIEYKLQWSMIRVAPLWIIALWLSFSFTLNHSLAFLRKNYAFAMLFGLVGGPLAYWCADRLFNVIEYGADVGLVMAGLGICWSLLIPAIFYIDGRISMPTVTDKAAA